MAMIMTLIFRTQIFSENGLKRSWRLKEQGHKNLRTLFLQVNQFELGTIVTALKRGPKTVPTTSIPWQLLCCQILTNCKIYLFSY